MSKPGVRRRRRNRGHKLNKPNELFRQYPRTCTGNKKRRAAIALFHEAFILFHKWKSSQEGILRKIFPITPIESETATDEPHFISRH